MSAKKSTDVMIAGKVYTLSGYEEEGYLQRVASYINTKISDITEREEFRRIPNDMKSILIELNIADDYFKARTQFESVDENYKKAEKDLFDLKHELVDTQMRVEELTDQLKEASLVRTQKSESELALEEKYRRLEEKYQLLLDNTKVAEEKNRQFEEMLRLSEQGKRELESVNQELRMNKEKLESALGDALLGAREQDKKRRQKQAQQAVQPQMPQPSADDMVQAAEKVSESEHAMHTADFKIDTPPQPLDAPEAVLEQPQADTAAVEHQDTADLSGKTDEKATDQPVAEQPAHDLAAEYDEEEDPELIELARQIEELEREEQREKENAAKK